MTPSTWHDPTMIYKVTSSASREPPWGARGSRRIFKFNTYVLLFSDFEVRYGSMSEEEHADISSTNNRKPQRHRIDKLRTKQDAGHVPLGETIQHQPDIWPREAPGIFKKNKYLKNRRKTIWNDRCSWGCVGELVLLV